MLALDGWGVSSGLPTLIGNLNCAERKVAFFDVVLCYKREISFFFFN